MLQKTYTPPSFSEELARNTQENKWVEKNNILVDFKKDIDTANSNLKICVYFDILRPHFRYINIKKVLFQVRKVSEIIFLYSLTALSLGAVVYQL